MTKIAIFSDLHLDHSGWDYHAEFSKSEYDDVEIFLNAGDTHPVIDERKKLRNEMKLNFPNAAYVEALGNHDYWGHSLTETFKNYEVYGSIVTGSELIEIVYATLWTDVQEPLTFYHSVKNGLNDGNFTLDYNYNNYRASFQNQLGYIVSSGAQIVMTHHAPSHKSIHEKFQGQFNNPGFYSDLDNVIKGMRFPPDLWVHGHVHDSCDYMIGDTRVICHPRGYPSETNHDGYMPLIIDMEL